MVKWLSQGHTARNEQVWNLNQRTLAAESMLLTIGNDWKEKREEDSALGCGELWHLEDQ